MCLDDSYLMISLESTKHLLGPVESICRHQINYKENTTLRLGRKLRDHPGNHVLPLKALLLCAEAVPQAGSVPEMGDLCGTPFM